MPEPQPKPSTNFPSHKLSAAQHLQRTDPEKYARLKAEAAAPYRGLRKFIYVAFAGSGAIGGIVFFTQLLAGREVESALPNLAIQLGVIALMVWLFRLENRAERKGNQEGRR